MGEIVMRRISAIFILFLLNLVSVHAENQQIQWLDSANQAYTKGNYMQAINHYEMILQNGYESAALYYNLGNAYYKQNIIDKAILNYERALLLKPNHEDIRYNLQIANQLTIDRIEKLPEFFLSAWIKTIRNWFSSDKWALISLGSFVFTLVFISLYLYTRKYGLKKFSFWLGLVCFMISIFSLIFSYQQKQRIVLKDTAIVMSPSVTVKSSPDQSGTDLFILHEGTKVWLHDQVGEWKEIRLSDGSKGWIKVESIEEI
ncbi:MAG: tetratricopeptide repeat protein [Bacteroidales bacterium]|nr:tetratricopeptide repeat protein [Bacteroidales bacterium]